MARFNINNLNEYGNLSINKLLSLSERLISQSASGSIDPSLITQISTESSFLTESIKYQINSRIGEHPFHNHIKQ